MLPLVGQKLSIANKNLGTTLMSACIVAAQFVMVPMAMLVGAKADTWGRKLLFLAALLILPIRGALYTFSDAPYWLVGVQFLDGIGAGIFGAIFPIIVADLMRGTGRFNVAQGAIITAQGQCVGQKPTFLRGQARYGGSIVFFGRFVALLRAFAALLAGANGLSPRRFFVFNAAGGIVWATIFGLGGYLLGAGIHRIAGPIGWAMLILALAFGFALWRYFKKHEESLLDKAELEMARHDRH
jgi:MFS family permease